MKRFILGTTIILGTLIIIFGVTTNALAAKGTMSPDDGLFPVQHFAEQLKLSTTTSPQNRAEYAISLVRRRALAISTANNYSETNLFYLEESLQAAATAVAELPIEHLNYYQQDLANLTAQLIDLLSKQPSSSELYAELINKLESLNHLLQTVGILPEDIGNLPPLDASSGAIATSVFNSINPQGVIFQPGSGGAEHAFFPLIGAHSLLTCEGCHANENYAGTATDCASCHSNAKPENHFEGDCASCHTPEAWLLVTFDHTLAIATDCQSCHGSDQPIGHFEGQCSACHSTTGWVPASFNHSFANATDCQACHSGDKPSNHFSGQCSACHTNTNNWREATFNHTLALASDCQSCHSNNRPANHFGGQCSACHSTDRWSNVSFNHSMVNTNDCQSCHNGDKPSSHFSGQCSNCHNTNNWSNASFDHSDFNINHGGANGNCSTCHTQNNYESYTCLACHSSNSPDDDGNNDNGGNNKENNNNGNNNDD